MIEDSILHQLRTALASALTREQLHVPDSDWEALEAGQPEIVRSLVKDVSYDGSTGAVSLRLRGGEARREN
jgi:hypothetical protein